MSLPACPLCEDANGKILSEPATKMRSVQKTYDLLVYGLPTATGKASSAATAFAPAPTS